MNEINEAFEIVFGQEFIDEMLTRLLIIGCSLAAILLIIISIFVWKIIACGKIKKAILSLSEHPDDEQAESFVQNIGKISSIGKFFARHGRSYSGLSKGDCRSIFNSTVLSSTKINNENKRSIRNCLMKIGCTGLTDIDSI